MSRRVGRLSVAALAALAGCAGERPAAESAGLEISRVYVAEPVTAERTALYLVITNSGAADEELLAVSTPVAGAAEIHRTIDDGGTVGMEPVESIRIPAGESIRLSPGNYHVMLTDLKQMLWAGDHIDARLRFRYMGELEIRPKVVAYADLEELFAESGGAEPHNRH